MPQYTYCCSGCGHIFDELRMISARNDVNVCPLCGKPSPRDVEAELADCSDFNGLDKENVRYSRSLGCLPTQLAQARKLHPGAEFVKLPGEKSYRMVIRNRSEKLRRMKERNMEEIEKVRGDWFVKGDGE